MTDSSLTLEPQSLRADIPLAVYREIAAHLRQVNGVETELLPQLATTFDYQQSQIGGITIRYTSEADITAAQRVQQILAYYGNRYERWQAIDPPAR
jgi:hypothetical protein